MDEFGMMKTTILLINLYFDKCTFRVETGREKKTKTTSFETKMSQSFKR